MITNSCIKMKFTQFLVPNTLSLMANKLCMAFLKELIYYFDRNMWHTIAGKVNLKNLPVFLGHYPSGTSFKCMHHWQQIITSDEKETLRCFDYGIVENVIKYGTLIPPAYDI